MYRCERCGTGFNPIVASASENCPRCEVQGVTAPLSYRLFEGSEGENAPSPTETKEEPA
jgi:hypothetical protein